MQGARSGRARFRLALLWLGGLAAVWTGVAYGTGGFVLDWHGLHVSARSAKRPADIAIGCAVLWILTDLSDARVRLARLRHAFNRLPIVARPPYRVAAIVLALATTILGWTRGSISAGGADSYGYVSQAHLWATGTLTIEQPIARELPWSDAAATMAPLGYRPTDDQRAIVPIYSPGLPIVMAMAERAAGATAVYKVVPLLGGVAVFAAFLLGTALGGEGAGFAAALLFATSPAFLYCLMWPMSDVPVSAWWTIALVLSAFDSPATALAGGLAAGMAVLTRPNLVVLCAVPGLWLIVRARQAPRECRRTAIVRAILFLAGAAPFCVGIGLLFRYWYGSALDSGYGPLAAIFAWRNAAPNLARYPAWLLSAETPVVLLGLAAPFVLARRGAHQAASLAWMLLAFVAATFAGYLFYEPFDAWWYLRFLLPAFAPLVALTAVVLIAIVQRLRADMRPVALIAVVIAVAVRGLRYSNVYDVREAERKYSAVGDYVARHLPANAIVLSMQHSGNVRLYGDRLTARYDLLPEGHLDEALEVFRRLGYAPYLVVERWELAQYHARFPTDRAGAPGWTPIAIYKDGEVQIYDYADAGRAPSSQVNSVAVIP